MDKLKSGNIKYNWKLKLFILFLNQPVIRNLKTESLITKPYITAIPIQHLSINPSLDEMTFALLDELNFLSTFKLKQQILQDPKNSSNKQWGVQPLQKF